MFVKYLMKFLFVVSVLLLAIFSCGCAHQIEKGPLRVVASIAPLSYFAERIGGRHVVVSVMVPPGGNPHSYEPTPQQMVRLGEATLFIKAGSGIEFELDWMHRFMSLNRSLKICNASEGIRLRPMAHDAGEHEQHGRFDPHYWLSPANGRVMVRNIERTLVAADPEHKAEYTANGAKLEAELKVLEQEIRGKLSELKSKRFIVFHPAWGYYADAFGLEQIAIEVEGKTITPRQMQRVIEKAKANRISIVFVSPQFSTAQAEAIAMEIGGKTCSIDPLASDYQNNLRRITAAFYESMR